ncbi:glycosyltransferase [Chromohalobacter sp. HP20-39]|uniref:glycosyltransferase n=1 Tax=Chromohalobacter sp. HP20-39 TaxID=3079306 RepID=UPI00294AB411|nr:glycosyltransferase [Chromohalobacter sp. HP20-39]MDV6320552.1 glycosyltransferase [Chromohalobacter sp. HP20-39]
MNKPTVIFVLGMHRSGTSAMAGSLAVCNVWLGDNLLEPAPGINDKGFWEHRELVRLNEALLDKAGLRWHTPLAVRHFQEFLKDEGGKAYVQELKLEASKFIDDLVSSRPHRELQTYAVKDPRLCITAHFWKPLFEQAGIRVVSIHVLRPPQEVARSLENRDGIVPSHSNVLWLDYVIGASQFSKELEEHYTGTFEDLMGAPADFVKKAGHKLGIDLVADVEALEGWVQRDLRHHESKKDIGKGFLADMVKKLYTDLASKRETSPSVLDDLDVQSRLLLSDIEVQFRQYNETVVKLQESEKKLSSLGEEHSRALEVIQERDSQRDAMQEMLDKLSQGNSHILDAIHERLKGLEQENSRTLDAIHERLKGLGQEHSRALDVIDERGEQLKLAQRKVLEVSERVGGGERVRRKLWGGLGNLAKTFTFSEDKAIVTPFAGELTAPLSNGRRRSVDVIIPVYRGLEETCAAVTTASETLDRTWARLIVINDCSPEPEVVQWLRENRKVLDFEFLENKQNLGFVGTVNRGLKLNPEADVLLLNSDVEVANDWLLRLQDCAYSRKQVASVTATANNATICSFPVFCEDNKLLSGHSVQSIDEVFRDSVPASMAVEVPSGVGCCMYLRRDAINKIGVFDQEVFGRGYGEENDWCQRAIQCGWKNLHALNVFVYHKGAVSFAEESNPRVEENLRKLQDRHPTYNADVHAFIRQDPARSWRVRLLCELFAKSERPLILAVSHGLGGGVLTHILELERELAESDYVLLEAIDNKKVRLSFLPLKKDSSPYLDFSIPDDYEMLVSLLKSMGVVHVHFHHTMRLPTRIWGVADDLGVKYDYTFHDFWVINGNPTLTGRNGVYAGDGNDRDRLCAEHYPLPDGITAARWRELQLALMDNARYLITPSKDTMLRISAEQEFRHLNAWKVCPHLDYCSCPEEIVPIEAEGRNIRVAILGALSKEKGADVLEGVASCLNNAPIEFHLLGYGYRPLSKNVITHGPYAEEEGLESLLAIKPDVVWFTAQWPETYSYTLSIALRAKLPIVAPKLGAFSERLSGRPRTVVLEKWGDIRELAEFWNNVCVEHDVINHAVAPGVDLSGTHNLEFYHSSYLEGVDKKVRPDCVEVLDSLFHRGAFKSGVADTTNKERILSLLLKLRNVGIISILFKFVPLSLQRKVKRYLSRKPLHEIK